MFDKKQKEGGIEVSVCLFCGKEFVKGKNCQGKFCSCECFRGFESIGSNAVRVGRMAYTKPSNSSAHRAGFKNVALNEFEPELKVKYFIKFTDNHNPLVAAKLFDLAKRFESYRLKFCV